MEMPTVSGESVAAGVAALESLSKLVIRGVAGIDFASCNF